MLVPAKPYLEYSAFNTTRSSFTANSFITNSLFFPSGRRALVHALRHFEIPSGSTILLPALICRSVSDSMSSMGLIVKYIDSGSNSLFPNPENLSTAVCETINIKALLLVDLFGFMPDERVLVSKHAREAGCFVFEDRCHSALSQPADEIADAVIFSFRKTLPCRDGGAVRFSMPCQSPIISRSLPSVADLLFLVRRSIEQVICRIGVPNIYNKRYDLMRDVKATEGEQSDLYYSNISNNVECSQSYVLHRQLKNAEFMTRIAERRRSNYIALQNIVTNLGLNLGFDRLPPDVVPQVLPVVDPSRTLVDFLRASGIGATRWPDYDLPEFVSEHPELFPNACRFNRQMAYLPIHQSIDDKHIILMANCIKKWKSISDAQNMDDKPWN